MKLLLLFTLCFVLSYAEHLKVQVHDDEDHTRLLSGVVRRKIEKIRDELKEKGFNNITWDNKEITLNLEAQKLHAEITASGYANGLVGFEVIVEDLFWEPINYNYELTWPNIEVNLDSYDLKGHVSLIQLFGNGKIKLRIENLKVCGKIFTNGSTLKDITTNIKLNNNLEFELTGWLNDDVRSEILSELVKSYVPVVMKKYEKEINEKVAEILRNFIKNT